MLTFTVFLLNLVGRISVKLITNHLLPSGLCFFQPVMFYNLGEALVVLCPVFVIFFLSSSIPKFLNLPLILLFLSYIQEV
jgi:hypothetical protein